MRKISLISGLLLLLLLGGCSSKMPTLSGAERYQRMEKTAQLPPMLQVESEMALDFYGINVTACKDFVAYIALDSLLADEVILLQAKQLQDVPALKELLQARWDAKAAEAESYSPQQYAIIERGQLLVSGQELALIVGQDIDNLLKAYKQ